MKAKTKKNNKKSTGVIPMFIGDFCTIHFNSGLSEHLSLLRYRAKYSRGKNRVEAINDISSIEDSLNKIGKTLYLSGHNQWILLPVSELPIYLTR